jgi:transcriptional regulator of acetoin/glycerol metabolism
MVRSGVIPVVCPFRGFDRIPARLLLSPSDQGSCRAMQIKTLKEHEKDHLLQVLVKTHWNIQKTALLLQIPSAEVKRKIKEHRLKKSRP